MICVLKPVWIADCLCSSVGPFLGMCILL